MATAGAGYAIHDRTVCAATPDRGVFYAPVKLHPRPALWAKRLSSFEILVPVD